MKRLTGTEKWDKLWFRKLPSRLKCFWVFLCDRCDCAGVWEMDFETASYFIGEEITRSDLSVFGEHVKVLNDHQVWIPDFVPFQCGELNPKCPPHKAVITRLTTLSLPLAYPKPTLSLPHVPTEDVGTRQDKTRQEEEKTRQEGDTKGENGTAPKPRMMSDFLERMKAELAKPEPEAPPPAPKSDFNVISALKAGIDKLYKRTPGRPWANVEERLLADICKHGDPLKEWKELLAFRDTPDSFFPRSVVSLLEKWQATLDRARTVPPKPLTPLERDHQREINRLLK